MSANQYASGIKTAEIRKADRTWFPRWIFRYASSLQRSRSDLLEVSEKSVIRFLRSLRDNGTPAWQRLQAARAVESYRNLVLKTDAPSLFEICQTLQRVATRERLSGASATVRGERGMVGELDPKEPKVIREMRAELRLMHSMLWNESIRTPTVSLAGSTSFLPGRSLVIPGAGSGGGTIFQTVLSATAFGRQCGVPGLTSRRCLIRCGTASRRICWRMTRIFAPYRSCWGTRTWPRQ